MPAQPVRDAAAPGQGAHTPAVMPGRVRVAPSPVPHPDLDVLRAATLQLAEWSGLVGHLHELMSGLSGCL
jgi:hypothetical protein